MPKLQIDGTDVAEVDAELAEKLRQMVSLHGTGRSQKSATFQQSVSSGPSKPRPRATLFVINLEFEVKSPG